MWCLIIQLARITCGSFLFYVLVYAHFGYRVQTRVITNSSNNVRIYLSSATARRTGREDKMKLLLHCGTFIDDLIACKTAILFQFQFNGILIGSSLCIAVCVESILISVVAVSL